MSSQIERASSQSERGPSFLGTGWSFPLAFSAGGAEVAMVSGVDDVHQSLQILLKTRTGERPMQETFGCDLCDVLFAELDHALVNRVSTLVSNAILDHEPRVALHGVAVKQSDADPGLLLIHIEYTVLGTNSRYNMVYPFSLNEAVASRR